MQETDRIYPSRVVFVLSLAAHALIALALLVYVEPGLLRYGGVILVLLFIVRECALWRRQTSFALGIDPRRRSITLLSGGQPYFQGKYKVYANRWFAILKLIGKRNNRTLILHRLRFDSDRSYRNLRFALVDREPENAA